MTRCNRAANDRRYGRSTNNSNGVAHHRHPTLLRRPYIEEHATSIGDWSAAEESSEKASKQDGLNILSSTCRKREDGSDKVRLCKDVSACNSEKKKNRVQQ